MKRWLKKVTKREVRELLSKMGRADILYELPEELDKRIRNRIRAQRYGVESKERKLKAFFSFARFRYVYAAILFSIVLLAGILMIHTYSKESLIVKGRGEETPVVTFISGRVFVKDSPGKDWRELDIFERVRANSIIRTEEESSLEIRYSNRTAILIQESTQARFSELKIEKERNETMLDLVKGRLLVKIEGLTRDSSFEIRTPSVICAVRGTKFIVESDQVDGFTKVVVRQGVIGIRKHIDITEELTQIAKSSKQLADSLSTLIEQEILIGEKKQLLIEARDVMKTQEELDEIIHEVNRRIETVMKRGEKLSPGRIENILEEVEGKILTEKKRVEDRVEDVGEEEWKNEYKNDFFHSERLTGEKVNVLTKQGSGVAIIDVGHQEAVVYLDDREVGRGKGLFKLIVESNRTFRLRAEKEGFKEYVAELKIDEGEKKKIKILWEREEVLGEQTRRDSEEFEREPARKDMQEEVSDREVIYETDFSQDDGMFDFYAAQDGKAVVENERLYLKNPFKRIPKSMLSEARLKVSFGNSSMITFRLKPGERFNKQYPFVSAVVHLGEEDSFELLLLPDGFRYVYTVKEQIYEDHLPEIAIAQDEWYDITYYIQDYQLLLFLSGRFYAKVELKEMISHNGNLVFVTRNECWVDDLRIVRETYDGPLVYTNDFEKRDEFLLFSNNEWRIVEDGDGNHVMAPFTADENSDLHLSVPLGRDFVLRFKFKRFPDSNAECLQIVDLGIEGRGNDWFIIENQKITFGNRLQGEYEISEYPLSFNSWHTLKLTVEKGREFCLYIDEEEVISYTKSNDTEYDYVKFEGNPKNGNWYLDDLSIKWSR